MDSFVLSDLFRIASIGPHDYVASSDKGYHLDYKTQECVFVKPVILLDKVGKPNVEYVKEKCIISKNRLMLINMMPELVLTKYVYYYLLANDDSLQQFYLGTIPTFNKSSLQHIQILVPSLSEQTIKVAEFDVFNSLIEKRKTSIESLTNLLQAYYGRAYKVSGQFWKKRKISTIASIQPYKSDVKQSTLSVFPREDGVVLAGRRSVFIKVKLSECNPYFLVCAIQAKIDNDVDVFINIKELSNIIVNLPSTLEQNVYEEIYKMVYRILDKMKLFDMKLNIIFKFLLHRDLYRVNISVQSQTTISHNSSLVSSVLQVFQKDIPSLMLYDEIRRQRYEMLEERKIEQRFDKKSGKIILVKL